jgi:hypothetical protein
MSIDVGELPTRRRGDVLSLLTDRRRGRLGEDGAAASGDHLLRALGHPCEDVEHEVRTACLVSFCAVSAGSMVNLTGLRTAICCPSGRCMCCSLARYGRPAGWASPEGAIRGESSGTCADSKVPPGVRVPRACQTGPPRWARNWRQTTAPTLRPRHRPGPSVSVRCQERRVGADSGGVPGWLGHSQVLIRHKPHDVDGT